MITQTVGALHNTHMDQEYTCESPKSEIGIVFGILVIVLLLHLLLKQHKIRMKKNMSVPTAPRALPYAGCLIQMLLNKPTFRWIHRLMLDMNTEILCIPLWKTNVYAITSPQIACEILKQEDANFGSRPKCMAADVVSSGYLTTTLNPYGEQWKKMRRIVSSELLSTSMHNRMHIKRVEEADHLIRYIYNQCDINVVNVRMVARHYCGCLIRKMIFGSRLFGMGSKDGGPGCEELEHMDALFTILNHLYAFCISDYVPFLRGLDLDGHEKKIEKAVNCVRKYQDPLVDERVKLWESGIRNQEEDWVDVLIRFMDAKGDRVLSTQEIKAQIFELMLATVDNPSNVAEWVIAEMLNQPELIELATIELDNVVGKDRLVEESDIPQLKYLKACAKESFRLHPIAPFNVPHVSITDCTVAGYLIPQGSHMLISRLGLGRNPKIWKQPLKFMPQRHLNVNQAGSGVVLTDSELKMLSFSTGRRGCPAVALGSTMTVMLLARLLQGFTWTLPPNMSNIELTHSKYSLQLAKPLVALATPRLAPNVYPTA